MTSTRSLILAMTTAMASLSSNATVMSTFSTDDEGWRVVSIADYGPYETVVGGPYVPTYSPVGGHPGGFISAVDPDAVTWWFDAPAAFLGDQSSSYGRSLSFDINQTVGGAEWVDADVALIGAGLTLVIDLGPNPPADTWTHFSMGLTEASGWKVNGLAGAAPTEAEIKAVLGSLDALRIRGEFSYGGDVGRLDNVVLASGPSLPDSGATLTLLGGALLSLTGFGANARRR